MVYRPNGLERGEQLGGVGHQEILLQEKRTHNTSNNLDTVSNEHKERQLATYAPEIFTNSLELVVSK